MSLLIRRTAAHLRDLEREITPRAVFDQRRRLLGLASGGGLLSALPAWASPAPARPTPPSNALPPGELLASRFSTDEPLTAYKSVTEYTNFYEFGSDKSDPARNAGAMALRPWRLRIEGLVAQPREFDLDDLLRLAPLEERIYRLRCVEAWSMVVPWLGYPLASLLKQVEPLGSARHVEFISHYDPEIMTRRPILDWPYREGLRLDEALHPLTLLCFGLYGEVLPAQNGAPLRLVVPWKYGFKSAKSLVTLRLREDPPLTSWAQSAPREYGYYANVNPEVDHPRWSQKTERRIGELRRRPTLPFNGYAEEVAGLYAGMDLQREF